MRAAATMTLSTAPAQGVTSWFIFSLIRGRGVPGAEAAVRISGLELGGLLGSLSAGAISDRLIKSNTDPNVGNVGLRVKVRPSQRYSNHMQAEINRYRAHFLRVAAACREVSVPEQFATCSAVHGEI